MRRSRWTAALCANALVTAGAALAAAGPTAAAATAASVEPTAAAAVRPATAAAAGRAEDHVAEASSGRDLVIVPSATLDLSAPPFATPVATVTYGQQVTLDEVRDDVPPDELRQPSPGKVPPAFGGRYVAVKVTTVNTGSQVSGRAIVEPVSSEGEVFGDTDLTLRGCPHYYIVPPPPVPPGGRVTGCIVYVLKTGVTVTGARATIEFPEPSASGAWRVVGHEPERRGYVALGDSYSSGEGSGDYDATDPGCHRGARAWPRLLARALPALLRMPSGGLIACSGATSDYLLGPELWQLDRVRTRPTLITLTIGGNDVGFSPTLQACVLQPTCGRAIDKARAAIDHEASTLADDYRKIRDFEPNAAVIVVGYPRLFPTRQVDVVQPNCFWLSSAKRVALNDLDASLDDVISKAAAREHLPYVNVTGALNDHEACTADSWIYPIPVPDPSKGWNQQDGHPTAPGQAAIAAKVESYLTGRFYS